MQLLARWALVVQLASMFTRAAQISAAAKVVGSRSNGTTEVVRGGGGDALHTFLGRRGPGGSTKMVHHIWPGTAYASIACGGVWQRAQEDGHQVASILGSSGGAASALILLASNSVQTLKEVYNTYARAKESWSGLWADTTQCEGDTDACWWQAEYLKLLGSSWSNSFGAVKAKGRVSLMCSKVKGGAAKAYVLYNFQSPLQAAQAYAAAGNGGFFNHKVTGMGWCWDFDTMQLNWDGVPTEMNLRSDDVWYYDTWQIAGECCQPGCWNAGVVEDGYKCVDRMIALGKKNYDNTWILQVNPSWAHGWSLNSLTATWKDLR